MAVILLDQQEEDEQCKIRGTFYDPVNAENSDEGKQEMTPYRRAINRVKQPGTVIRQGQNSKPGKQDKQYFS